jgi:phage terminase small subunit
VGRTTPDSNEPDRQTAFIEAYTGVAHLNGTKAATIAGYASPRQEATRLLAKASIRARIHKILSAHTLDAADVLAELTDVARAEWRDFVMEITNAKGETIGVRMDLSAKMKALELLGKAYKLYVDKREDSGPDNGPIAFTVKITEAPHAGGE